MRLWFNETVRTLSVTTVHPLGWGWKLLKSRLNRVMSKIPAPPPTSPHEREQEHACPVLFIHGIFHNSTAFYRLERKLSKRGFATLATIELWTSLDSLEAMIRQLEYQVMRLQDVHRAQNLPGKVRIVAHSLGGMITRAALLDPEFARRIDKVIFLGTPHRGSLFYNLPFPLCLRDLSAGSSVMKRLNAEPLPSDVEFWNFRGGVLDIVTPHRDTLLPHVRNFTFDHVGHAGLLTDTHVIQSVIAALETPTINGES